MENQTEELKKKEGEVREVIVRHRLQMGIYEKEAIKGLEEIEILYENEENQLKKKFEEQVKIREELMTKYLSLQNQEKFGRD